MNKFEVRKATLDLLGGNSSNCSNIYEVELEILKIYEEGGETGGGGSAGGGGKTKVNKLKINDSCIVDGKWNANSIDTSLLTSMNQMFSNCISLQELDLSGWNVSNVTNMVIMFNSCEKLQTVGDISSWNVSNVTSMQNMFYNCNSLQELDLSGWNVSNVTNIYGMFSGCYDLQTLDVSGWDTSKVTSLKTMFFNCRSLTELDLSGWDTSNVTTMYDMFSNCYNLQTLDVSGWNTSNVTDIDTIFYGCSSLKTLDLTSWNGSKINYAARIIANSGITSCVGNKTINEVIDNNIAILNGLKVSTSLENSEVDRASIRALINGVADLTGQTAKVITLHILSSKITEEDIAIATAKNWTIA